MPQIFQPSGPIRWSWVSLSGPDAKDFLHRLTTVNLQSLAVGQGQKGFFLTAQGKVRAYFTLWSYQKDEYGFEFDAGSGDAWKKELLTAIDQFTFAEKMTLTDVSAMEAFWIFDWAGAPLQAGQTIALEEGIRLCHHGEKDFGRTWISAWGTPQKLASWVAALAGAETVDLATIEGWRVQAMQPWTDRELTQGTIPLEAGLREAIAENKGCYPGQEVIERIISLGSPARRLAQIEASGQAPAPGEKLFNLAEPPVEIGEVTSVAAAGGRFTALGFVKKIHAKEGNEVRIGSGIGKILRLAPYA